MRVALALLFVLVPFGNGLFAAPSGVFQAENAELNPARTEVVAQESFHGKKGVGLKKDQKAILEVENEKPDLAFKVRAPRAGRYVFVTHAAVDEAGQALMAAAKGKQASLAAMIQVDRSRPTSRIVFVPWSRSESCTQTLGIFELSGKPQLVKFWLPVGTRLDRLEVREYRAPAVPQEAANYRPAHVPPAEHPRLWVTPETLPKVRAGLRHPENLAQWKRIRAEAAKPFAFSFDPKREVPYNTPLENAAAAKAFVYLMEGEKERGREAVQLMVDYLPRVEFGNMLDITREIGAAIYTAARVYDWCYDLCTPAERTLLRRHMMRLSEEMECGWPPFHGPIVNGHGNEAMTNRDLLSMSIAVYNEDPQPYRYCAYRLLEQLVPMRRFEYQSPRHNQGVSYSSYRFGFEMHAAWLFRRMLGREVFDPNIKTVPTYWLYMRLPNGEMLRDGDGVPNGKYWSYPQTALLCYSYGDNAILKGEFQRQNGRLPDPLLHLLLNDPSLKAEPSLDALPLTVDFGPILGGMIARTGWNLGETSSDVVAEIKGGGYHAGNHQHADAGAMQIYYRGLQVADLGQYKFYGPPYDMNFNKRSVAHSMVLVRDPAEKFLSTPANDGGSRFLQAHPSTPEQAQSNPLFHYGKVLSCSFGPSPAKPAFSYFAADLKSAYSDKLAGYVRRFCFLNLNRADHPAAIIVLDDLRASNPEFKKYWQLNTLQPPRTTPEGVELHAVAGKTTGRFDVRMLLPKPDDRVVEIKSGKDSCDVFGQVYQAPVPSGLEASGHRVMFSPKQAKAHDRFLAVLQACDADAAPLPCESVQTEAAVIVRIADRIVGFGPNADPIAGPFEFTVPSDGREYQVLLTGLQAGVWSTAGPGDASARNHTVEARKNTLFFLSKGGRYRVAPTAP